MLNVSEGSFTISGPLAYPALNNQVGKLKATKRMRKFFWAIHMKIKESKEFVYASY